MKSDFMFSIVFDTLAEAPAATGGGTLDILLQLARLGVAGLAIYILYLAHNLYQQANSGESVDIISAKQKGATKYLTSSYLLVAICALVEVLRLFGPHPTDSPVRARIGVAGWREDKSAQYGFPEITLAHGQDEIPVPAKNTPREVTVRDSDHISFNLGSMIDRYDELANQQRQTKDELLQQKNTSRTAVLPKSESLKTTEIH